MWTAGKSCCEPRRGGGGATGGGRPTAERRHVPRHHRSRRKGRSGLMRMLSRQLISVLGLGLIGGICLGDEPPKTAVTPQDLVAGYKLNYYQFPRLRVSW